MSTTHAIPDIRTARHGAARRTMIVLLAAAIAFSGLTATAPAADAYTTPTVSCSQLSGDVRVSPSDRWQYVYLLRWNGQHGRWDLASQGQFSPFVSPRFIGVQSSRANLHYTAIVYHWINGHGWVEQGRPNHITYTRSLTSTRRQTHCTVMAG